MDSAIVFPGMGPCDFATVARFMLVNPVARRLVAVAGDVLGYDLFERYRETSGDYSEYAQVAFFVNCVALGTWAREEFGVEPGLCAGASFGGKAAAVHSGALGFADGVRLTAELVRYETEYFAAEHPDVVTQSFVRVPGERLAELLAEMDERGEWYEISCQVDDDFHMLSVHRDVLDGLRSRLRAHGGLPLYVMDPPLHCRAFGGLRDRVEAELFPTLMFTDPAIPVVADQDGSLRDTAAGVRDILLDGIVRPVRWPAVVGTLRERGVRKLYVSGPDQLWGRVGVTTRNFEVVALDPRWATRPRRRDRAAQEHRTAQLHRAAQERGAAQENLARAGASLS